MGWRDKSPQQKADSFDAQYERSKRNGDKNKAEGKHPYELDKKIKDSGTMKPAEKRGKGRHAK